MTEDIEPPDPQQEPELPPNTPGVEYRRAANGQIVRLVRATTPPPVAFIFVPPPMPEPEEEGEPEE